MMRVIRSTWLTMMSRSRSESGSGFTRSRTRSARPRITSLSLVSDSVYGKPLPEIYTDIPMPVSALIITGRDENEFYEVYFGDNVLGKRDQVFFLGSGVGVL